MTLTEELETHPIFETFLREIIRYATYGPYRGGSEPDPEGFGREPFTGAVIYDPAPNMPDV